LYAITWDNQEPLKGLKISQNAKMLHSSSPDDESLADFPHFQFVVGQWLCHAITPQHMAELTVRKGLFGGCLLNLAYPGR
jgi:hypothetical protein